MASDETKQQIHGPQERAVVELLDAWNRKELERIMSFFLPDATYHNMPLPPVSGLAAIRGTIEGFFSAFTSIDLRITRMASRDDVVHTERVDTLGIGDSGKTVAVPVAGTFHFEQGKLKLWRDYFDLASFERESGLTLG